MPEEFDAQASPYAPWPNAAVQRLEMLAGQWSVEIYLPTKPATVVSGQTLFEWLGEGYFLVERSEVGNPNFPKTFAIIGSDGAIDSYSMIYYDSRGVSRIYQMRLTEEEWTLWRDEPGFMQRFTGHFSDNGNTIKAYWEKAAEEGAWELDFDLLYTRVVEVTGA